jgi:glycerol-3-phosphate dehydrogenase (NAD(P)+)
MPREIGIVGAGGWGTALAKVLADKGERVTLWCHGTECYRELTSQRENRSYLPGIQIPDGVKVTQSLENAVGGKFLVICAVPSHAVREVFAKVAGAITPETLMLCATKGLEEGTNRTMGELFADLFGPANDDRQGFLSGPTFAREVALGLPTAMTVAARLAKIAEAIQETLSTPNLRVYTSTDVLGVQMGGVVKNSIAIAAGISDGLGLGHNARAALITRGLAEMTRLATQMGADSRTLSGLPGLGDLVLTCTGDLSRNRNVGLQIAAGKKLAEITDSTRSVAEGVRNTRSLFLLAQKLGVEIPIVEQMYAVLYLGKQPALAVRDLMQRSLKAEGG